MKKNNNEVVEKQNTENEETKLEINAKLVVKTVLKTLLCVVSILGFVFVTMSVVSPKTMSKFCNAVGLTETSYLINKRVYERNSTNENLYNVIQLAIEKDEYEDIEHYIKLMINGDHFADFSVKIDEKTKAIMGEEYSVCLNSYEDYLMMHLTESLYKNGKIVEARMYALDSSLSNFNEMYSFVMCIDADDELTNKQKKNQLLLIDQYSVLTKLDSLAVQYETDEKAEDINVYVQMSLIEQQLRLCEIKYVFVSYIEGSDATAEILTKIQELSARMNSLKQ